MNLQKITKLSFLLTIFFLPAYLIKFSFFSIPTNLLEIFALFSLFLFILNKKTATLGYWKENLTAFKLPFIFLFSGLLLSFLTNPWSLHGLGIIKSWFVVPFFFSLSLATMLNDKKERVLVIKTIYFSIAAVSFSALGYKLAGIVTYDQRLTAFYLSPNHLAMFLAPGFFLTYYLFFQEKTQAFRAFLVFSLLAITMAFYFTFSYSAWLAVALSFVALSALKTKRQKVIKFLFASLVILGIFLALQWENPKLNGFLDQRSSFSSRVMIWNSSLKIIRDNPLFGIGPGNFQASYLEYQKYFPPYLEWAVPQPHNLYLAFYLQTGLLGLIGFVLLCYRWFVICLRQKNTAFFAVSLGILLYFILHGLVDTPYWKNDLAFIFWIFVFLAVFVPETLRDDGR